MKVSKVYLEPIRLEPLTILQKLPSQMFEWALNTRLSIPRNRESGVFSFLKY